MANGVLFCSACDDAAVVTLFAELTIMNGVYNMAHFFRTLTSAATAYTHMRLDLVCYFEGCARRVEFCCSAVRSALSCSFKHVWLSSHTTNFICVMVTYSISLSCRGSCLGRQYLPAIRVVSIYQLAASSGSICIFQALNTHPSRIESFVVLLKASPRIQIL